MARGTALPQSFLFSGPRRLGKFLVALEFAETLADISPGAHARDGDILVLGREKTMVTGIERSPMLLVENIREAEEFLSRFPVSGRYRIVIIDGVERLTLSAENALLRLLEEPNSTSVIILVTHLPGKLLATVRSRLFPITFSLLSADEIRAFFPRSDLPNFFLNLGLPGLIAMASEFPQDFEKQKTLLRDLFQLSRLTWKERLVLAEKVASDPDGMDDLLEIWMAGLDRQQGKGTTYPLALAEFFEALLETLDQLALREGNPRLLLEKLFIRV